MIEKIKKIIEDNFDYKIEDGRYFLKINENEQLDTSVIQEILDAENPQEAYSNFLYDMVDKNYLFLRENLESSIRSFLSKTDEELYEEKWDEINEFLNEYICYYYDENYFNDTMVSINLMIDTGDANLDFTCNNQLNFYADGSLPSESPLLWLARTQGKSQLFRNALSDFSYDKCKITDGFISSLISELENLPNAMSCLTFCFKIPLFKLIEVQKAINKSTDGYITLDPSVACGLFSPWEGGGSVFEIEQLEKDVKIPFNYIHNIQVNTLNNRTGDYTVSDVYGISPDDEEWWRDVIKEVVLCQ